MLLGTKICMLYWREYVKNGCAIAGFRFIKNDRQKFSTDKYTEKKTKTR